MFDTKVGWGKDVSRASSLPFTTPLAQADSLLLTFTQDPTETLHYISNILLAHRRHVETDAWAGFVPLLPLFFISSSSTDFLLSFSLLAVFLS